MKMYKSNGYIVAEVTKKGNIINIYYECQSLDSARELKKRKIKHLVESGLIEGTVVIFHNNKIVN